MTESLNPFGNRVAAPRARWSGILSTRAFVTLAFVLALGGCGGAGDPGQLGSLRPYFHTSYSGMLSNAEPDEGAIPSDGRTYRGSFRPLNKEAVVGVQFLLGNLTSKDIRGATMLIGISTNGNDEQVPTKNGVANNVITGDPRTGWVQVTIGGASDLPVPASQDGESGAGLAWTDLVTIANNLAPGEGEIVWRLWVPSRAKAPYARTYSQTVDGGMPNEKLSAVRGLSVFEYDVRGWDSWQDSSYMHYGYVDGDAVSDLGLAKTWTTTPPPPIHYNAYAHIAQPTAGGSTVKAVAAVPVLGVRWKVTRDLPVIEMVGDSITQGYHDRIGDHIVGVDGVPGRLVRTLGLTKDDKTAKYTFINFGQSGWTPEQYLARWKGLARADALGATAMVYSIYSPNGFVATHQNQARIEELKANCLAAEKAAHDYGRIFIPSFITGTNYGLIGTGRDETGLVKNLLEWAIDRYGTQLLDLHSAVQPTGAEATIGPSMASKYTGDQTHPNWDGYDALGKKAVEIFPSVYEAARAAQMSR